MIPPEGKSQLRRKGPDTPRTSSVALRGLSIQSLRRPAENLSHCLTELSHVSVYRAKRSGSEIITAATTITPVVTQPLLEQMTIRVGGIRTIGGGTSREAIRTAKRKNRRSN